MGFFCLFILLWDPIALALAVPPSPPPQLGLATVEAVLVNGRTHHQLDRGHHDRLVRQDRAARREWGMGATVDVVGGVLDGWFIYPLSTHDPRTGSGWNHSAYFFIPIQSRYLLRMVWR